MKQFCTAASLLLLLLLCLAGSVHGQVLFGEPHLLNDAENRLNSCIDDMSRIPVPRHYDTSDVLLAFWAAPPHQARAWLTKQLLTYACIHAMLPHLAV